MTVAECKYVTEGSQLVFLSERTENAQETTCILRAALNADGMTTCRRWLLWIAICVLPAARNADGSRESRRCWTGISRVRVPFPVRSRSVLRSVFGPAFPVYGLISRYPKRTAWTAAISSLWEAILEPFGLHDLDSYMAADQDAVNEIRCGLYHGWAMVGPSWLDHHG